MKSLQQLQLASCNLQLIYCVLISVFFHNQSERRRLLFVIVSSAHDFRAALLNNFRPRKVSATFQQDFFIFYFNLYSTIFKTRGIKNILSSLKCDLFHTIQLVWSSFPTPEPEPDPPVPSFSYLYMPRAVLTHLGPQESHSPNFAGFRTDSLAYEDAQPSGEDLTAQNYRHHKLFFLSTAHNFFYFYKSNIIKAAPYFCVF